MRSGILLPGALLACVLLYGQEKWKGKETWPVRAFYQKATRHDADTDAVHRGPLRSLRSVLVAREARDE